MRLIFVVAAMLVMPCAARAKAPDCPSWPTNMAFVHLKNAGLVSNEHTNPEKATVVRLASEKIDKDRYRQVYRIAFHSDTGPDVEVITSSEASFEECSMSPVDVYVVSRHLGGK